jgi:hypothetical protein
MQIITFASVKGGVARLYGERARNESFRFVRVSGRARPEDHLKVLLPKTDRQKPATPHAGSIDSLLKAEHPGVELG